MLDRQDMIALIKVVEAFNRLNNRITVITNGYGVACEEYDGLYEIYEVIRRNCRYSGASDKDEDTLRAIINAINKTPEEKCDLLWKQNNNGLHI